MVEVGAPWGDGKVVRKLPPLKYYHDFEISESRDCSLVLTSQAEFLVAESVRWLYLVPSLSFQVQRR